MYKDKDKQREANRERQRRYKARHKGVTSESVTNKALPVGSTHYGDAYNYSRNPVALGKPKRGKDIKCFADLPPDVQATIDSLSIGKIDQTVKVNRAVIAIAYHQTHPDRYYPQDAAISSSVCTGKPGDADYDGICTPEWRAERGR